MSDILFYSLITLPLLLIIGVLFFPIRFSFGVKWGDEFKFKIWLWNISLTRYKLFFKKMIDWFLSGLNLLEKVIKKVFSFFRFLKKLVSRTKVDKVINQENQNFYDDLSAEPSKAKSEQPESEKRLSDAELMREVIDDIAETVDAQKSEEVVKKEPIFSKQASQEKVKVAPKVKSSVKARPSRFKKLYGVFKTRIKALLGYLNTGQSFYKAEKTVLLKTLGWGVSVLWRLKGLLSITFKRIDLKLGSGNPYQSSKILVYKPFVDLISPFKENSVEIEWTKPTFEGEILIEVDHKIYKSFLYLFKLAWNFPWCTLWLRFWVWFRPVVTAKILFVNKRKLKVS